MERDPLERPRASVEARHCRPDAGRRRQRRVRAGSAAAHRRHDANATGCVSEQALARGRARLSAARSIAACAFCRAPQREAMFEIYSFCRAVDDIADDPGPREPRRGQLAQWRADIDAIYRGAAAGGACRPGAGGAHVRSATRGFPGRHRRHGDGRDRRYPRARPRRRSIFIATASPARSAGFRCGCSAWSTTPASRSRIISAARCS